MQPAKRTNGNQTYTFGPYKLGKTIGQGEFGKVKIGKHLKTGSEVAIKFVKKNSVDSPTRREKLSREINMLQSMNHRYIVELYEVIETDGYIGLIMEYASGGELFEYILSRDHLTERESGRIFAQLIDAVTYMHMLHIIHRDLKLENILIDRERNIKITDFGFANSVSDIPTGLLQTSCGSPCYAAPELVNSSEYQGEKADIWSCDAMLCGTLPFDDDPNNENSENMVLLYKYIMETKLTFPLPISEKAMHLVRSILQTDPVKRASIPEIKTHVWMRPFTSTFKTYKVKINLPAQPAVAEVKRSSPLDIPNIRNRDDSVQKSPLSIIGIMERESRPIQVSTIAEEDEQSPDFKQPPVLLAPIAENTPIEEEAVQDIDEEVVLEWKRGELVQEIVDFDVHDQSITLDAALHTCSFVEKNDSEKNVDVDMTNTVPVDNSQRPIPCGLPTTSLDDVLDDDAVIEQVILPLNHKQSMASMASSASRLNRKSVVSFVVVEKPSKQSIFDENGVLEELLAETVRVERKDSVASDDDSDADSNRSGGTVTRRQMDSMDRPIIYENEEERPVTPVFPMKQQFLKTGSPKKGRVSLNLPFRGAGNESFKEQATRAQSLDASRYLQTDAENAYFENGDSYKYVNLHSGPIDNRAISDMSPPALLSKIAEILADMNLEFEFADDPFKLIVQKTPEYDVEGTENAQKPADLNRKSSRRSSLSTSTRSKKPLMSSISSLFQTLHHISLFGLQFNRGFDGSSALAPIPNSNRVTAYCKFHIVIHRIRRLDGLFIVDFKRYKGDIWEFKRLYNEIVTRLDLQRTLVVV